MAARYRRAVSAGAMKDKIVIEKPTVTVTDNGERTHTWTVLATIYARWDEKNIVKDSGRNGAFAVDTIVNVNFRTVIGLDATCRVKKYGESEYWYVVGSPDIDSHFTHITAQKKETAN